VPAGIAEWQRRRHVACKCGRKFGHMRSLLSYCGAKRHNWRDRSVKDARWFPGREAGSEAFLKWP